MKNLAINKSALYLMFSHRTTLGKEFIPSLISKQ